MEKLQYKGYEIEIVEDDCPQDPRGFDNLGTMICFHRRYNLGDKHQYNTPEQALEDLAGVEEGSEFTFQQLYKKIEERGIILIPLGLIDHSGISMYIGSGSSPFDPGGWDSGQVGFIYITKDKIIKEYGDDSPETRRNVEKYLEGEVKVYDDFLTGNVWSWRTDTGDGCSGYYGDEGYKDAIAEAESSINSYITSKRKEHFKKLKEYILNKVPLIYRKSLTV